MVDKSEPTYSMHKFWLDAYKAAWQSQNPAAIADLFGEQALYQISPFQEPLRGREAITAYWRGICETQQNVRFSYELFSVQDGLCVAHWWVNFQRVKTGKIVELDGILVFSLAQDECCSTFREWYLKKTDGEDPKGSDA